MRTVPRASLIVLTGGRSTRMGRDKAAMDAGGMPLAARPVRALAGLCDDVVLAGRAVEGVVGTVVADEAGVAGPLGGVLAGLRAARRELCVVAGCDMPAIDASLVALLLDALEGDASLRAACCARSGGLLEPLPFAIRREAGSTLAALHGAPSLRDGLTALSASVLPESVWSRVDPEGWTFESWNRPEDIRPI